MDAKLKHLEFIQNTISRMANNSFLIKGWTITLVTAVLTLGKSVLGGEGAIDKIELVLIAMFIAVMFWLLDGFFLCTEARFRLLYDKITDMNNDAITFEMNPLKFKEKWQYVSNTFSKTLIPFYGALFLLPCFVYQVSLNDVFGNVIRMLKSLF